jgi:hypothetical protein
MQETVAEINTCSVGNQLQLINGTNESAQRVAAGKYETENGNARVKMRQKRLRNSELLLWFSMFRFFLVNGVLFRVTKDWPSGNQF